MPITLVFTIIAVNVILAHKAPAAARSVGSTSNFDGVWILFSSAMQRAAGPCLFVLFFALPMVSSLAFRAFNCECFTYSKLCYLRADYEFVCGEMVRAHQRAHLLDRSVHERAHVTPTSTDVLLDEPPLGRLHRGLMATRRGTRQNIVPSAHLRSRSSLCIRYSCHSSSFHCCGACATLSWLARRRASPAAFSSCTVLVSHLPRALTAREASVCFSARE